MRTKQLKTENIKLPVEAESSVRPEPRGVVVLIVPWNYPLLIASWNIICYLLLFVYKDCWCLEVAFCLFNSKRSHLLPYKSLKTATIP